MRKDIETQAKFFNLRLQGKTLLEISEELEISIATANRWNRFFKADIINARNSEMDKLRAKIARNYDSYFDFLNESICKMINEVRRLDETSMNYESLMKNINMLLNTVNKIDVFRKFSDKSCRASAPENIIPENDRSRAYAPKNFIESLKKADPVKETFQATDEDTVINVDTIKDSNPGKDAVSGGSGDF